MNDTLNALKKATNVSEWTVDRVETDEQIRLAQEKMKTASGMDAMRAMGQLALASNLKEEYGSNFAKLGLLDNELLSIPREDVDEVVARVLQEGQ